MANPGSSLKNHIRSRATPGKQRARLLAGERQDQPALRGCIDVDIQATPITNTLPIRRLDLKAGESMEIRLCYISMPDLIVSAASQRYTALDPGSLYRFESLEDGFTADLPVDQDGFVLDYPGLFKRLG